ncbi:PREDICTED: uncharacterized protein LOC109355608 isoform X2 [Lupinus angustifolius]|uniref:uncharacterized protein LOC109355608 isoform X2 n=1 Tax=Lupinus angustifolius TaxID=3871 RepID=UPI00092E2740|nr:PREDICTED: uncharacterized protein LOC109355608 isoform X2 [Lupinus angustifolius]
MKMINVLGLSLILTSLAVATVFSPSPSSSPNSNTILKDGHRVVVVEYDQDGNHNTKISISPPGHTHDHNHHASKDLICDAYGRCKHKIADAMDGAKDIMSETAHDAINMIHDKKDNIADAVGKARETMSNRAYDVQHQTKETVDKAKEKAYDVQQQTKETVDKAKEKAYDVQQQTKETVDKAKEKGQRFKEHVVRNVSEAKDSLGVVRNNIVGSMETVMGVVNLLGLATAYGMNVWVTFISSYVLSRAMSRQSFGMVQSKIYPLYFRAMAYFIGIALLGHVFSHAKGMPHIFQAYNLLASLLTIFINSMYLEPRATKLMLERMKIEKEEGRGRDDMMSGERIGSRTREQHHHNTTADPKEPSTTTTSTQGTEHDVVRSRIMKLNEKLEKLNSYSSILNILNLMSLTWHLVYLAQRLHLTC